MPLPLLAASVFWAYVKRLIGGVPVWAVLLAILAGGGYWWGEHCRALGHAVGAAEVQAKFDASTREWDKEKLRAALVAQKAEADARAEERRTAAAQLEIVHDAHTAQVQRLQTDVAAGRAASDRLREHVNALAAASARAPGDPAAASGSPSAEDAGRLLAELQRRADARAGEMARIADERGIAGEACVRSYESLTSPPGPGLKLKGAADNGGLNARAGAWLLPRDKGINTHAMEFPGVLQSPDGPPSFNAESPP